MKKNQKSLSRSWKKHPLLCCQTPVFLGCLTLTTSNRSTCECLSITYSFTEKWSTITALKWIKLFKVMYLQQLAHTKTFQNKNVYFLEQKNCVFPFPNELVMLDPQKENYKLYNQCALHDSLGKEKAFRRHLFVLLR